MRLFLTHRDTQGFTLVETLVAISILLLVIVGPMTVAQKGIQNAYFAREQLTAVFLAQEATESVRELRDNAALNAYHNTSGDPTWSWIPTACNTSINSNGCGLNGSGGGFIQCYSGDSCKLKISTEGQYGNTGLLDSPYTRVIKITPQGGTAASVEVKVIWNSILFSTGSRTVTLNTWIYDHYKRFEN